MNEFRRMIIRPTTITGIPPGPGRGATAIPSRMIRKPRTTKPKRTSRPARSRVAASVARWPRTLGMTRDTFFNLA